MIPFPDSLAGYQELSKDTMVQVGDLIVMGRFNCKDMAWVGEPDITLIVGDLFDADEGFTRVYRRIPVAKQGDNDDTGWKAVAAGAKLPSDAVARKNIPIATGFVDYFPLAIAAVAAVSRMGNDQHNPGKPLHWDRSKSADESDALMRHFMERGKLDKDGARHSAKLAWRAMALLEKELEAAFPPYQH